MASLRRGHLQVHIMKEIQLIIRCPEGSDPESSRFGRYRKTDLGLDLLCEKYPNLQKVTLCVEIGPLLNTERMEEVRLRNQEQILRALRRWNPTAFSSLPLLQVNVSTYLLQDLDYDFITTTRVQGLLTGSGNIKPAS